MVGTGPLHTDNLMRVAIQEDNVDALSEVVAAHGAGGVNTLREEGWHPLLYACMFTSVQCVEWLLAAGIDVAYADKNGDTALHVLLMIRDTERTDLIVQCLRLIASQPNAPLSAYNMSNEDPLMLLLRMRTDPGNEMFRLFLRHGMSADRLINYPRYDFFMQVVHQERCRRASLALLAMQRLRRSPTIALAGGRDVVALIAKMVLGTRNQEGVWSGVETKTKRRGF